MYMHGVRIQENPTTVPTPVTNESSLPIIFGTAPVNLAKDPTNATNKLFLCRTFAEAREALGYSGDYQDYTLCQAMDAYFKVFGVGPIILCNVLDPTIHKKVYSETLSVVENVAVSTKKGVMLSGLTVKSDASTTLTMDTEYTLSFNADGYLVVTVISSSISSVIVSGTYIDPTMVTEADIVGSYDSDTGVETGIELVRKVYPKFGLTPGLLLAPGWSHKPVVGLALIAKCKGINGVFTCECVLDLDCSAAGAKKHIDVDELKKKNGYENEHAIILWPKVKIDGKVMAYSTVYAAMVAQLDFNNDGVPNLYPSNKAVKIEATVLEDGTEVNLDFLQANELNGEGIVTAINSGVFKAWGNNTSAYPNVKDQKERWIACRRFFSWWGNRFIVEYMKNVDDMTNFRLIESIVDSENVRGNALKSQGKCAGIRMAYKKEDNQKEDVLNGKIVFRQYLAPFTPAEDILNILEFDPSMIEAELGGE